MAWPEKRREDPADRESIHTAQFYDSLSTASNLHRKNYLKTLTHHDDITYGGNFRKNTQFFKHFTLLFDITSLD